MQSYEDAGGYGLPAYYDMSLAASGYAANPLMAAYGLQGAFAATPGLSGLGGFPRRGMGLTGMAAARGGRGSMLGGLAAMRGRGAALAALGRGGAMSAAGLGRGGGKMRGGRGAGSQRFNPMGRKQANPSENELGHIVFAYNIGENTTEEDVRALFSLYGTVAKVDVIMDFAKNITKGYAFVTMPNQEEAEYAIQNLNGYNYAGKPLQVSFKSDKKKRQ